MTDGPTRVEERHSRPRVAVASELRAQTARVFSCSPVEFWEDGPAGVKRLRVAEVVVLTEATATRTAYVIRGACRCCG